MIHSFENEGVSPRQKNSPMDPSSELLLHQQICTSTSSFTGGHGIPSYESVAASTHRMLRQEDQSSGRSLSLAGGLQHIGATGMPCNKTHSYWRSYTPRGDAVQNAPSPHRSHEQALSELVQSAEDAAAAATYFSEGSGWAMHGCSTHGSDRKEGGNGMASTAGDSEAGPGALHGGTSYSRRSRSTCLPSDSYAPHVTDSSGVGSGGPSGDWSQPACSSGPAVMLPATDLLAGMPENADVHVASAFAEVYRSIGEEEDADARAADAAMGVEHVPLTQQQRYHEVQVSEMASRPAAPGAAGANRPNRGLGCGDGDAGGEADGGRV